MKVMESNALNKDETCKEKFGNLVTISIQI